MHTSWRDLLEPLRDALTGRDHRGRIGSLRWLEHVVAERGGRAGTVRNILYKDAGGPEEKLLLYEVLAELYARAGLRAPQPPRTLAAAKAKRVLGRDKRRIFNRFARALAEGGRPQEVVVGGPATGKGTLLEQLHEGLPHGHFVNLTQELSPALFTWAQQLGITTEYERLVAQLSSEQPYAVQAALQTDVCALFAEGVNRAGVPLLLRAEAHGTLGTLPLRDGEARVVTLPDWLAPLLEAVEVPMVAALESPPAALDHQALRPPTLDEARRYLRERIPDAPPERVEALLRRAGRSYGELSRLALLEMIRVGEEGEERILDDPQLGPMLRVLAALSPEADPAVPQPLLEEVLGRDVADLSAAERALLEPLGGESGEATGWRPALRSLLPPDDGDPALHERAFAYYRERGGPFRRLHHAFHAGRMDALLEVLDADASRLALLPGLWRASCRWPAAQRERLALMVVRYRAVLGDYVHPEAREALELLHASSAPHRSGWARVKTAEAFIDAGRFEEAEERVADLPPLEGEAQVEALLVRAAIARWHGTYEDARRYVREARTLPVAPLLEDRVRLWNGLVAKDAGRFEEALDSLARVDHSPLLAARARYQEGDLLTRLGRPEEGAERMRAALRGLRATAPREEQVRVEARLGTPLRHLGRYDGAARALYGALERVEDPFTRARIQSEASILESARGRPWPALDLAAKAEAFFRTTRERPEEAAYRHRRTVFRLAAALWVRGTGHPYRAPFRGGVDVPGARKALVELRRRVVPWALHADRDAALLVDTVQMLALMLPAGEAIDLLDATAVPARADHQTQLSLSRAEALLRQGEAGAAAAALAAVRHPPPEPGTHAWRSVLEAMVQLAFGREAVAREVIEEAFAHPAPFRHVVGLTWGDVLQAHGREDLAGEDARNPLVPLPEALALRFSESGAGGEE